MASKHAVGESGEPPVGAASGPPFPKWMYAVINPLIVVVLRSPFHRLVSANLMLLSFDGRKSGRRFTLPVGYLERGSELFVLTHSGWAVNLKHGVPVAVRLRGAARRGTAVQVADAGTLAELAQLFVAQRGLSMAQRVGMVAADGSPAPAVGQPICIKIQLED